MPDAEPAHGTGRIHTRMSTDFKRQGLFTRVSTVLCKLSSYTRGSGWGIMISES